MADINRVSVRLRKLAVDEVKRTVRIAFFPGTEQSADLSRPPNCRGFGRLHSFSRSQGNGWPLDSLPIDPARHALGLEHGDEVLVQIFQIAVCNFRCWYCYVDRATISGSEQHSEMLSARELVDYYLAETGRAKVIDLTGGQPDLVPEWTLWLSDEIRKRGLENEVYIWTDDNLSTDFLWRYLDPRDIQRIASSKNYGRVGCFKGFDENSFSFNTGASPDMFDAQFGLMRKMVDSGFDVYGYVTLTSDRENNIASQMSTFVDRLQSEVHPLFPLRTVPQRILEFSPTKSRATVAHQRAMRVQDQAVFFWEKELEKRFSNDVRSRRIYEHSLV